MLFVFGKSRAEESDDARGLFPIPINIGHLGRERFLIVCVVLLLITAWYPGIAPGLGAIFAILFALFIVIVIAYQAKIAVNNVKRMLLVAAALLLLFETVFVIIFFITHFRMESSL